MPMVYMSFFSVCPVVENTKTIYDAMKVDGFEIVNLILPLYSSRHLSRFDAPSRIVSHDDEQSVNAL